MLLFALGAIAYATTAITADQPLGWIINGSDLPNYEISVDTTVKHSGRASARIKFIAGKADGFGGLMQMFTADDYREKRIRISAWLRSEEADAVQLWLASTVRRAAKGTSDWNKYEITLDVPANTVNIAFGAMVVRTGVGGRLQVRSGWGGRGRRLTC